MSTEKKKGTKFEVLTPQGYEYSDKPQKMKFTKRTHCVKCGLCCRTNPPTLLKNDMALFAGGSIQPEHVAVIREGEPVYSLADKEVYIAPFELLMVRGRAGSTVCSLLSGENVCDVYENRPAQCKAYACYGPQLTITGLETTRMVRRDLFGDIPFVLEVIDRHDEKCSYRELADALEKIAGGDEAAVDAVIDMLQYDIAVRPFVAEKLGLADHMIQLILGKPLLETIRLLGYQVDQEGEDYTIKPLEKKEEPK
ncbi:MAG TPA: YkgJ family cysteine cluster protein [Dissulfurispiraceae bacterium]|nr:YkgJ family cysteine cluster protein [Dissulfurispiraceae bacterium]